MLFMKMTGVAVGLFCVLTMAGCEGEKPKPAQTETVKIGVVYPFSGLFAHTGEDLKAGVDLAAEIVNGAFDLDLPMGKGEGLRSHGGARIKIIYRDSQNDTNRAAEMVEDLVRNEGVKAVIGCYSSTITAAASERAEMLKVPFLNEASTSPTLTQRGLRWFFRTTPHDEMFAQNFFSFLSEFSERMNVQIPGRLILVYENRLWGTSVAQAERKLAIKHDYEIIEEVPYDAQKGSFDEELERIKRALPGLILQSSYDADAILFMKGYKAKGMDPIAILAMDAGFISPSFVSSLGADAEYVLSREVWALDIGRKKPLVTAVNDLFSKRVGRNMSGNSARAFTALITLADAMNRASSLDAEGIREALLQTDIKGEQLIMPWDGVKFDPKSGQNILGKGIVVQVQRGEYVTVWPWDLSSRPVVWPMPLWENRESVK